MDWNVIIEALLWIAGVLGLGALATKFYNDGKRLKEVLPVAQASIMKAWNIAMEANADNNVTQEEYNQIMEAVNVFMKDFNVIVSTSEDIVGDLFALTKAIEEMVNTWRGKLDAKAAAAKK
jgi:hypothetical protein